MMKEMVLQPSFYDKFECIGGACKNTCCHDWTIHFSKEEFKNIKRKMKSDEFKEIFQNAFDIKKGNDLYSIKLDEKGNCKFLDECGLCRMYKEVGPENMSLVCKIFPRFGTRYADNYEYFLSVGCEEVVKLVLQEKDGILLDRVEKEMIPYEKNSALRVNTKGKLNNDEIVIYWNTLKMLLLGVLQNREYAFGERMAILGIAMKKVDEMNKEGKIAAMQKYIEDFVRGFNDVNNKDIYDEMLQNVNRNHDIRAINTLQCYNLGRSEEKESFDAKIIDRIEVETSVTLQKNATEDDANTTEISLKYNGEKYQQAVKDFEEFLKGREWWIENVMIEGFLAARMPFFIGGDIWKNYCAMVLLYSSMLFMWTCCIEKDSTEQDFINYTVAIARRLFHNEKYIEKLEKHLEETESNTLAHMAMLVL